MHSYFTTSVECVFVLTLLLGRKPCLRYFANKKGADQNRSRTAHSRRQISAFVIRVLEEIISNHAKGKIRFSS